MKKKLLSLVLALGMAVSICPAALAEGAGSAELPDAYSYSMFSSEEEWKAHVKEQIAAELSAQGIESGNIYFPGDPMPLNDIDDYKTEVVGTKEVVVSGYPGGQNPNGVTFDSELGGSIWYVPKGGPTVSVTVSFGTWGSVSVALDLGRQAPTGTVTGYSAFIPGGRAYKLWVDNTYSISKYVTYKRVWVDDFTGYQWVEYTSGTTETLMHTKFTPKPV